MTADPFQHTEDAVRMLRLRRYQLLRQGGDARAARALLRRPVRPLTAMYPRVPATRVPGSRSVP